MPSTDETTLLRMLEWYLDMGGGALLDEQPVNWLQQETQADPSGESSYLKLEQERRAALSRQIFQRAFQQEESPGKSSPVHPAQQPGASQNRFPLSGYKETQHLAGELARSAHDIAALEDSVRSFEGCALKVTAHKTCFCDGNPAADLMIVGEAPGRDEDLQGRPFVGRAGQLLDKIIEAIGLSRLEDTYITNTVYWRPPGNRAPTSQEMLICQPFLYRQIELVQPKVLLVLGNSAAKSLLDTKQGIMRLRGKWKVLEVGGRSYDLLPSLHPSYLLRTPLAKRLAYHDFLQVQERLESVTK